MDLYETLGVPRDATAEQIKAAYRRLASQHHPDKNPDDPEAHSRMQEIQKAYDVLGDAARRKQYDETGQTGQGMSMEEHARASLAQIAIALLNNKDADFVNLTQAIQIQVDNSIEEIKRLIKTKEREATNAEKAHKRLVCNGKNPFLITALGNHARQLRQTINQFHQNIELAKLMLTLLNDYEYQFEKPPAQKTTEYFTASQIFDPNRW